MVDPERIRRFLATLRRYVAELEMLSRLDRDSYQKDASYAGRYLVQASAQICIDIANHLIASEGWRPPSDFRDTFAVLEENGTIGASLAERMRDLAGLRNRLVHLYEEVDDAIVFDSLAAGLADVDAFAQAIARLVAKNG